MEIAAFALALVSIACPQDRSAAGYVTPAPTPQNVAAWKEHILPAPEEQRWESIPWHQTFGEGLLEANRQRKPLLLWAMNGHPLGCT